MKIILLIAVLLTFNGYANLNKNSHSGKQTLYEVTTEVIYAKNSQYIVSCIVNERIGDDKVKLIYCPQLLISPGIDGNATFTDTNRSFTFSVSVKEVPEGLETLTKVVMQKNGKEVINKTEKSSYSSKRLAKLTKYPPN